MPDAPEPVDREMSAGRGAGFAFAAAFSLTVLMAAPVVQAPKERIFGSGEILSRSDPNRDALVVIDQFRTGRVPKPYLQPLTDLPGRALARIVDPVIAYNIVVLLTFPLSALGAYLLARHLSLPHFGAMVAGLAYAFAPFHVMQAGGHPHPTQRQWLPLYLLALFRSVDRPDPPRLALMLTAATAATLADFYGGFIIAVLSPAALLAYGVSSSRQTTPGVARRMGVVALVLFAAATAGVVAVRYLAPAIFTDKAATAFARSDLFEWSARWWSYLVPPLEHPLWGNAVREFWAAREVKLDLLEHQQVSLSLSLVALSLVPLWRFVRGDRSSPLVTLAPALAILAASALLCSLSPERAIGPFTFARPSAFLYEWAPMFRAYSRFGGVVALMTALLGGVGAVLLSRSRRPARTATAVLLSIAAIEYAPFPPWRSRDVLPTAAHRWLSAQSTPMRVLDCVPPLRVSDTLAARLIGHPLSFLGAPALDDCGEPRLGEKLSGLGYTHLIIRRDTATGAALEDNSAAFASRGGLTPTLTFQDAWVLSANKEEPRVRFGAWSGFYPREYEHGETWRWMGGTGTLDIVAPVAAKEVILEISLRSFPGPRRVRWSVEGGAKGSVEASPEWSTHALHLGSLHAGESLLTLASDEPPVAANDVLRNGDLRTLGLAVGTFTIKAEGK